ncbi:hypothetical protein HJ590_09425 [Naumannella sp. ID2617S]|nr:hypothetical protein [Naumannella sp. ID2617S]
MPAVTPHADHLNELPPLASRYVDVEALPWQPTASEGITMKVLLSEPETGLLTALFKWEPGARLYRHEHVEIEQTYVLEGSIIDAEGTASVGNFSWRPKGNQHEAWSPDGALVFCCFLKPNKFLEGPSAGKDLLPEE